MDSSDSSPWTKRLGMTWLMGCLFAAMLCLGQISPTFWQNSTTANMATEQPLAMKSVADFEVGDSILAYNHVTRKPELSRVKQVFERTSDHLRLITFADQFGAEQLIKTTDEHPFWSARQRQYVEAVELRVGDEVLDPDGNLQTVQSTVREEHPDGIQVYNVEVEKYHNYFVKAHGANAPPILSHNTCAVFDEATGRWRNTTTGQFTKRPIVVGESMARVSKVATKHGADIYVPPVWHEQKTTAALLKNLQNNKKWLDDMIAEGRPIIDIGLDSKRLSRGGSRSIYYHMEKQILKARKNDIVRAVR